MDAAENDRQYHVVNQMLSMHSALRDRYARRALLLNIGLISCSVVLCAFRFADDKILGAFGFDAFRARIGFGMIAIAILVLSIVELRVKWKEVATSHGDAAMQLARLKHQYRRLYAVTRGSDPKKNARLGTEYDRVMKAIPPIPARLFTRLKASHNFNKVLSQRISANPKAPTWFLRWQLGIEGIRQSKRKEVGGCDPGTPTTSA